MPAPLSDELYGAVADTMSLPRPEAAAMLGVSVATIAGARKRLNAGRPVIAPLAWTADEDDAIQSSPFLTAAQLAENLPGRSPSGIKRRRQAIGALEGVSTSRHRANPFAPAGRFLIAKTCTACGVLRPGGTYRWQCTRKTWSSRCVYCLAGDQGADRQAHDRTARRRDRHAELQAASLPGASRNGQEYTGEDMKTLADSTLTTFQKAIRLQRTHHGVHNAIQKYGFASVAPALGDPERDVWIIDNPYLAKLKENA